MSTLIRCSNCEQAIRVSPSHAGKMVRCPSCKSTLRVPAVGETPPPSLPPPPPPSWNGAPPQPTQVTPTPPQVDAVPPPDHSMQTSTSGDQFRSLSAGESSEAPQVDLSSAASIVRRPNRMNRTLIPSTSFLDIFDLSFTRFVTPLIVKITWILVLLCGFLWIASLALSFVVGLGSDLIGKSDTPSRPNFSAYSEPDRAEPTSSGVSASMALFVIKAVGFITFAVAGLTGVLWMRVILEGIIVIFKIAETLTDIRSHFLQPTKEQS